MEYQVVVCAYDESWPQEFAQEAQRLREVLGENCLEIHHIGSTAVPGLAAKPIIDFMLVVRELEEVDRRASALEELGYEYLGEFGIPGRRYLRKGGFRHTHHLHIFSTFNKAAIERHLAVRDYLRFLSGGCSKDPVSLLKDAGVDMMKPDVINDALALFGELVEEMDALMSEKD